jgi:hypothetical protein
MSSQGRRHPIFSIRYSSYLACDIHHVAWLPDVGVHHMGHLTVTIHHVGHLTVGAHCWVT